MKTTSSLMTLNKHVNATMKSLLMLTLIIGLVACGGGSHNGDNSLPSPTPMPPASPPATPPASPPAFQPQSNEFAHAISEDVGMDPEQLAIAFGMAESNPALKSLLVLKDNQLIAEQYFNGSTPDSLLHIRSVTKTIMAIVTGMALENGLLDSLDVTIGEYLLDDYPALSEAKRAITIRHLLTMSSGFQWDEADGSLYSQWSTSADPIGFLLQRDLQHTPGTRFAYNSAAVHLLARILFEASEGQIVDLVVNELFTPLNIEQFEWEQLNDGLFNGSAGLQLTAIDMLKFGHLISNQGMYVNAQGEQVLIVSASWINEMLTPRAQFSSEYGDITLSGYGYLTWLSQAGEKAIQLAWGWGGQFIAISPNDNLIVVANNNWFVDFDSATVQEQNTLALIVNGIYASVIE